MVSDFMQHGYPDLLDQLLFIIARKLDIFLKNVNHVR